MTDLEKAIRFICLFDTNDKDAMAGRYLLIQDLIRGENEKLLQMYVKKYEKMLDLLDN